MNAGVPVDVVAVDRAEGIQHHFGGVEPGGQVGGGRAAAQGDGDERDSERRRQLRLPHRCVSTSPPKSLLHALDSPASFMSGGRHSRCF